MEEAERFVLKRVRRGKVPEGPAESLQRRFRKELVSARRGVKDGPLFKSR